MYTQYNAASDPKGFIDAITRAAKALIAAEPEITQQDTVAGDGDAGLTLKAGAEGKCSNRSNDCRSMRLKADLCVRFKVSSRLLKQNESQGRTLLWIS